MALTMTYSRSASSGSAWPGKHGSKPWRGRGGAAFVSVVWEPKRFGASKRLALAFVDGITTSLSPTGNSRI